MRKIPYRKWPLFIFLVALIAAGSVHLINRSFLKTNSSEMLRRGITVRTSDDASYLVPVENFLNGNGWRSNAIGDAAFTTRSPGYGLFYLGFRAWLSPKAALAGLMLFQMVLFAWAVSLIPQIAFTLGLPEKWGLTLALLVAILPTFSGFLSYTLTEGLTPALLIIFLSFLLKATRGSVSGFSLAIFVLSVLILVRPAMLVWIFALPIAFWKNKSFERRGTILFGIALVFLPLLTWQVWAFAKTDTFAGLHPIYHADSNDLYRPLHHDIWGFHKSWGQKGVEFHREMVALWRDARAQKSPEQSVNEIIASIPSEAVREIGKDNLKRAYLDYYQILSRQAGYFEAGLPVPGIDSDEAQLSHYFREIRDQYVREHWFYSQVIVPLRVYWRLAGHSNLSLFMFQAPLRGNFAIEFLRYFSFFIHAGIFILFLPASLAGIRKRNIQLITLPVLIYLGYLCIVQRGVEERYTAPVLIPMFLIVMAMIWQVCRTIQALIMQKINKLSL